MTRAVRVHRPGGPDALVVEDIAAPEPGAGQVLVRVAAAGVNFIDVYQREGRYPQALPFTIGQEGAGTVTAVGAGVTAPRVGDRVGWANVMGAYAECAVIAAERAVPLPDDVSERDAAAALLQGMTAHYLTHDTHAIQRGDWVLIHAGAGGVGLLLTQLAKRRGATVIATVSTSEKEALSRGAGADHVIRYGDTDFAAVVKELTGGVGVRVVYDSVGKSTFAGSLASLAPRGLLALFGGSSGAVPPLDPMELSRRGSLFLTRPTLAHYIATRAELLRRSGDVFTWLRSGELRLRIERAYPLGDAAAAHRDIEGRRTAGKLLLLP